MKKSLISIALFAALLSFNNTAKAQISNGGLPLSKQGGITLNVEVPTHKLVNPLSSIEAINEARDANKENSVYEVAKFTNADLKFPESGVFEFLPSGQIIWKTKLVVEGAPAIGTYFDLFDLPKGVSLYMYNGNTTQMLGAYTIENVSKEDKLFAVQAIQGNVVNIELNIDPSVDLNNIGLSIDKAAVYYEGISYLDQFADNGNPNNGVFIDADPYGLQGRGADCHMDAACYEQNWDIARRASLQMLFVYSGGGLGMCSAAMINSLGNTSSDCKNYILTASHCQSNAITSLGDTINSAFSQALFRYNFEKTVCNSNERAQVDVMTGANYVARSPYNGTIPAWQMDGDFMLLQLRVKVPASYNSVLAGWDINSQPAYNINSGQKYIGYHHPSGDIKKVSFTHRLISSGDHLIARLPVDGSQGAVFGGTSGSAGYNNNSNIVGIASTASGGMTACPTTTYSELNYYSLAAGYEFNMSNPKQNLKTWLDPNNTGATTASASNTQTCSALSVMSFSESLDNSIQVYPNPSTNGIINVKFDFDTKQDVTLEIFNVVGAKITDIKIGNVSTSSYSLDMSSYNNGLYIIKCSNGNGFATKKVTIAK